MIRRGVSVTIRGRLISALSVSVSDNRISVMREQVAVDVALGLLRKGQYRL